MEMEVTFPGGARVDASFGPYVVRTDQPPAEGGEGSAPTPFALFLASFGTCAGVYVLGFLRKRSLPTDGVKLIERAHRDPATGMTDQVEIEILLPAGFPEKYREAIVRAAEQCAVKKHLEKPPAILVSARQA
ncbi:MAG: OsmC family protein [Chloroflexi bacterium]|jgi:ribosomal protein S12 methylthiotransferase accessory factor|nr:OsmC family protein [Chloroflexota bacterium]